MPLPVAGTPWPPRALDPISRKYAEWDAWWSGEPDRLRKVYRSDSMPASGSAFPEDRYVQESRAASVIKKVFSWGRKPDAVTSLEDPYQLHVPIAADLCKAPADLLYAVDPAITTDSEAADEAILGYLKDGLIDSLSSGAEVGAALGDHYLHAVKDGERVFLRTLDADQVVPSFRWGRLVSLTVWGEIEADHRRTVRHVEVHELDGAGNGIIRHAVYEGTKDHLGDQISKPDWLLDHVGEGPGITIDGLGLIVNTGPGLDVQRVQHATPNRIWRDHPIGCNLGRSALSGLEPLLDALDAAYSRWMRDVDLAKGRMVVASSMLDQGAPGQGQAFNRDRAVFTPLTVPPGNMNATLSDQIQLTQFKANVEEHRQTCQDLTEQIIRAAGYSAATFGEDENGGSITATEVVSRDRRTTLTRGRVIRLTQAPIELIIQKMLTMSGVPNVTVTVDFELTTQESPVVLAQIAVALRNAQAASDATIVRTVQPDWTPEEVAREVAAIQAARAAEIVTDPAGFGMGGAGITPPDDAPVE